MRPISANDKRHNYLKHYDVILQHDPKLFEDMVYDDTSPGRAMKAPSALGVWTRRVLWMGAKGLATTN
jgi:hypothetical protein